MAPGGFGHGVARNARRPAQFRIAARFDERQLECFIAEHRNLGQSEALITRSTPLLGGCATIVGRQIVTEGAVQR